MLHVSHEADLYVSVKFVVFVGTGTAIDSAPGMSTRLETITAPAHHAVFSQNSLCSLTPFQLQASLIQHDDAV